MDATLPEGWVTSTNPATGQPYYYHAATKQSTWEHPGKRAAAAAVAAAVEQAVPVQAQQAQLPAGWTHATHPENGLPYFIHDATRNATWDFPTETTPIGEDSHDTTGPLPLGWQQMAHEAAVNEHEVKSRMLIFRPHLGFSSDFHRFKFKLFY